MMKFFMAVSMLKSLFRNDIFIVLNEIKTAILKLIDKISRDTLSFEIISFIEIKYRGSSTKALSCRRTGKMSGKVLYF